MRLYSHGAERENGRMSTSPDKPCVREGNEATTQDHARFIDRHRLVLLRYLDGTTPESAEEPDALGYVENVLTEWNEVFGSSELSGADQVERTFWLALYQLEELVEFPCSGIDPYEKLLMETLVEVREMLRHRQPLPAHRFIATRPNGT